MKLFALFVPLEDKLAAITAHAEFYPFEQHLPHAELARLVINNNIEIAGIAALKRRLFEKLRHHLFGVGAAAQVERQLEAVQVYLIADIRHLFELAALDEIGNLGDNLLYRHAERNLQHINAV